LTHHTSKATYNAILLICIRGVGRNIFVVLNGGNKINRSLNQPPFRSPKPKGGERSRNTAKRHPKNDVEGFMLQYLCIVNNEEIVLFK
jgi:hypothetical protein